MNRQHFWSIISTVDQNDLLSDDTESALNSICTRLSTESTAEIEAFADHLAEVLHDLDTSKHFSYCAGASPDSFLYSRCFAVGMGERFYTSVLKSPSKMPPATKEFELLLQAPQKAWSIAQGTDQDDWNYRPKVNVESGTNPNGWLQSHKLRTITFRDSQALNKSLRELHYSASIALNADVVGLIYVQELDGLAFTTKNLRHLVLHFKFDDNDVTHNAPISGDTEIYSLEVDPRWYVSASERDRHQFFVQSITNKLSLICLRDDLDIEKVNSVCSSLLMRL